MNQEIHDKKMQWISAWPLR